MPGRRKRNIKLYTNIDSQQATADCWTRLLSVIIHTPLLLRTLQRPDVSGIEGNNIVGECK